MSDPMKEEQARMITLDHLIELKKQAEATVISGRRERIASAVLGQLVGSDLLASSQSGDRTIGIEHLARQSVEAADALIQELDCQASHRAPADSA